MNHSLKTRVLSMILAVVMVVGLIPMNVLATETDQLDTQTESEVPRVWANADVYDTTASGEYFKIISSDTYDLAPGAQEHEIILNNAEGNDRKVVHVFEVDTKNEDLEVMPGYYGIDELDPDNLPLDGIADKAQFWKAEQLTKTVKYYEDMGYNVVGAMNTALAYDSNAPYGYMVWNGVVLGTPEVHKGAQTYLAIDWEGNCELRSMSTPLTGNEKTAISANFGWLVKDGKLVSTKVERTSSDASRSMIGIKADGTLIFCQVDGRNAPFSSGLSDYEMGEMMLALGCVNAVNCDGGGSSTFVSKRAGEAENTMRSVPSDGSERATINSVILVSTAGATGIFEKALIEAEYNYIAPGASMPIAVTGLDTKGFTMDVPAEVTYQVVEEGMGTIVNGVFTAGSTTGTAIIQAVYNGEIVGEKLVNVVHPDFFGFEAEETVLPYGKSMELEVITEYGADDWFVCVDGAYTLEVSNTDAATLEGTTLTATTDESIADVIVTVAYTPDASKADQLKVTFGKGSEILFDFENGDIYDFMGMDEMYDWAEENGAPAPIQSNGNYSDETDSETFLATRDNGGQVKNGDYALGVMLDYTNAAFASWTYNMFFHTGEPVVLRDVANGKAATTFGMWVYIPEGAAGLAMQLTVYAGATAETASGTQLHFTFPTVSGAVKNLNSCTEADIPESRWVYATCDLTAKDYVSLVDPMAKTYGREPCFIRFYVKPTTAAMLTFYFDDFTLDYSSAVDDRILPTISDITYATQDSAVELTNGATINGNTVTFAANVADNLGLNTESGTILVDGIELTTSVSGKVMVSNAVTLGAGVHTVSFEIQDKLGNPARVTRTFTVAGDAPIVLDGHNDGGFKPGDDATVEGAAAPEYDSVYYVDLQVADFETLNGMTATLKLQSANTWEPAGITVAPGFKVTSCSVNEYTNELTITVTKGSSANIDAGTPLVSIPVRLWSWDGVNHVTDAPIAPETQYATGNNPVVAVDCEVIYGQAEYTTGEFGAFGGKISVATKINDVVFPWHYHDDELTVMNQEATCTEGGYENRTYCETCKSVVDWGTVVTSDGHNYTLVENQLVCECGETLNGNGLVTAGDKIYCLVAGKTVSGWQMVGENWCYASPDTMEVQTGEFEYNNLTYTAEPDGRVIKGIWAKTLYGYRYYLGPNYHKNGWLNIDGKDYYFEDTCRLDNGWQLLYENQKNLNWYYFNEDGTCDKTMKPEDGFYTYRMGYAYAKNGEGLVGLQTIDGKYYYFHHTGYALNNGVYAGLLFMDDYAGYTGFYEKDGVKYYYINGITATNGLYKIDGEYYYVTWGGLVKTNGTYYIETTFCDLPIGDYRVDEEGKLINGILEEDGVKRLYINGQTTSNGLYKLGDDYYYATWGGVLKTDGRYYVDTTFCDLPIGNYSFGADGKMLNGIQNVNGALYLYLNGTTASYGLYEVDGEYYYSNWGGTLRLNGRYYVDTTFCDLPANRNYTFGPDGRMYNGIEEVNGKLYLYENGTTTTCGLYKVDGEYYYSNWGGVLRVDGRYYVDTTFCDLPKNRNYSFGPDGKMYNGVEEVDGKLYLYENGTTTTYGLYEVDGEYYYSNWGGVLRVDGTYYVDTTFCDLPKNRNYSFGPDGKMFNGIEEIDGTLYLYENGMTVTCGLYKVDGAYYYANWGGALRVDGTYYVDTTFCDLPKNRNYSFGADGKMLDGFVTKDDGIYYYVDGINPAPGLIYVDGDYYYVNWGGKLVTNQSVYVEYTNGYTIPMNYTFDEFGRLVDK